MGWLAVALATAAPAWADDKATRDAQARFVEGLDRVKAGDFEAARVSFLQAYSVLHKPDILWNLALAEQKSGHPVEAITHFKQLRQGLKSDADRAGANRHITELMDQTAHIEVSAPAGAQVTVDGAAMGMSPLPEPLDVAAGKHHVEVAVAPGDTRAADADAVTGQVVRVSFLQAQAVVTPAPGTPPPVVAPPPPPPADTTPPASSGGSTFWDARGITVVSIGGLAVVSAALGLSFGIVSNNDSSTASTLRQQNPSCGGSSSSGCQQLASTTSSQHSAYVTSEGFWIGAAVLAVGAAATWFLWPKDSSSSGASVQVLPAAGPGGAGALAIGSF